MSQNNVAETLLKASKYIEAGWCKGALGKTADGVAVGVDRINEACEVCLAGAIHKASPDWTTMGATRELLGFRNAVEIGRWNDRPERTKDEVLVRLHEGLVRLGLFDDV